MKTVLAIIAIACMSLTAQAYPSSKMSWEQLKKDNDTRFLNIPLAGVLGDFGVLNACYTEHGTFKSVQDVKVCAEYSRSTIIESDDTGSYEREVVICERFEKRPATVSRKHLKSVCTEWTEVRDDEFSRWECKTSKAVEVEYPLSFNIDVYVDRGIEVGTDYAFTKRFDVPACK